MKAKLFLFLATLALCVASCSTKAPVAVDLEVLKAEIQKLEDAYASAEKDRDADGVAAYYGEDAVSYNRNEEPTFGRAAIRERIAARLQKDTTGNYNVYKVVDLFVDGDMVVEIGSSTALDPSGAEVEKGYYMSCFQKREGKYVCVRDMNVSVSAKKEGI